MESLQTKALMLANYNEEVKPKPKNALTNFLVVYFDCAYFLFCSPFRLVRNESSGYFSIRKTIPQFIIYAVQNGLAIIYIIANLRINRSILAAEDNTSPLKYFELLGTLLTFGFQLLTMKTFLLRQTRFLKIVNFIQSESHTLPTGNIRIQRKLFICLLCCVFAVMALYECIWKTLLAPSSTWHKTIWNRRLVSEARYAFFLTSNISELRRRLEPSQLSTLDYFLAFLGGLANIHIVILAYFPDLCLLFAVFTVWTAAYHFSQNLQNDMKYVNGKERWEKFDRVNSSDSSLALITTNGSSNMKSQMAKRKLIWSEVYQTYQSIRDLYQFINEAFGTMVIVDLANCLVYHATGLDGVLVATSITTRIQLLFFIGNSSCTFLLAADACDKMETLKVWLAKDENRRDVPLDQLNMVMGELRTRDVGVRGSNIFTITYPLLWNVVTTVVTYFIICLQSRQQQQNEKAAMATGNCSQI